MSIVFLSSDAGERIHKFITVISEAFAFLPTFTCFLQFFLFFGVLQEKHTEININ